MDTQKFKRIAAICKAKAGTHKKENYKSRDKAVDHVKAWAEADNRAAIAFLGEKGVKTIGVIVKGSGDILYAMLSTFMEKHEDFANIILLVANDYIQRHEDDEPNE